MKRSSIVTILALTTTVRVANGEPSTSVSSAWRSPHLAAARPTAETSLGRTGLGGALLFSVAYGLALSVPIHRNFSGRSGMLAVPVAGPTLAIAYRLEGVSYWGLVMDQIGQLGGLTLVTADLLSAPSSIGSARHLQVSGAPPAILYSTRF